MTTVTFDVEAATINKGNPSELFDYEDGSLYWKYGVSNSYAGRLAGRPNNRGYWQVKIKGKMYLLHHLIWWIFHGYKPNYIDHINGNPSDNHIENLRECTLTENQYNAKKSVRNQSGYKNVFWHRQRSKWAVKIGQTHYGYFEDLEVAAIVANEARINQCKDFRRDE